jgi:adenosylcobinamide hydrolase
MPMSVWRFAEPVLGIASGPLGGGVGTRNWAINATVDKAYGRLDPDVHLLELAAAQGLAGDGVGMLTAVDVTKAVTASDGGATVVTTVGLGHPTWASAPDGDLRHEPAEAATPKILPTDNVPTETLPIGTINTVAWIPAQLSDAALVNMVATATEAKVQALWECDVKATGTASDALFVACALPKAIVAVYGGPRSLWGARLARAVYASVAEGTRRWFEPPG